MNKCMVQSAGECGLRSVFIMLGTMDSEEVKGKILSMPEKTQERDVLEKLEIKIRPIVRELKFYFDGHTTIKPESKKDMGKVMKEVSPKLKGRADMKKVSTSISSRLT